MTLLRMTRFHFDHPPPGRARSKTHNRRTVRQLSRKGYGGAGLGVYLLHLHHMKTPSKGPWIRDGYIVRQPGGRIIADVGPHHTPPDEYPLACKLEDEANGDAIAALPELVEALQAMVDNPAWLYIGTYEVHTKARAALKKAGF